MGQRFTLATTGPLEESQILNNLSEYFDSLEVVTDKTDQVCLFSVYSSGLFLEFVLTDKSTYEFNTYLPKSILNESVLNDLKLIAKGLNVSFVL